MRAGEGVGEVRVMRAWLRARVRAWMRERVRVRVDGREARRRLTRGGRGERVTEEVGWAGEVRG